MTASVSAEPIRVSPGPRSPAAESLLARLDDPHTAAALHDLLDNAELLALMVSMVDGVIRRSETLTGNLSDSLAEVRLAATGGTGDLRGIATDAGSMLKTMSNGLPALQALLQSRLVQPATITALDTLTAALVEGMGQPAGGPARKPGVRALLGELRDPDTFRGLSTLLGVARSLGRRTRG